VLENVATPLLQERIERSLTGAPVSWLGDGDARIEGGSVTISAELRLVFCGLRQSEDPPDRRY
jgi:hypothetical protein